MKRESKGERISSQLMRALMIMQTLYNSVDGLQVADVAQRVNGKWCERTIRRDLETLVAIGFCTRREIVFKTRLNPKIIAKQHWYQVSVGNIASKLELPDSHKRRE